MMNHPLFLVKLVVCSTAGSLINKNFCSARTSNGSKGTLLHLFLEALRKATFHTLEAAHVDMSFGILEARWQLF